MKKKSLFLTLLVASLMLVSTLSLSSCSKEEEIEGETIELPVRAIDNTCYVCGRPLTPAPAGTPLPPPLVNTDFSCYHEYQLDEICPFLLCNLYPRHHYHFFYVGHTHNDTHFDNVHIGGAGQP